MNKPKIVGALGALLLVLGLGLGGYYYGLVPIGSADSMTDSGTSDQKSGMSGKSGPRMDEQGVIHTGQFQVEVSLDPQTPPMGEPSTLTVQVADRAGEPVTGARVRAVIQRQEPGAMTDSQSMSSANSMDKQDNASRQSMDEAASEDTSPTSASADSGAMEDAAGMQDSTTMAGSTSTMKGNGKRGMPALAIDMREPQPGRYTGTFELPQAGQWALAVDVETEPLGHADLVFDVPTGKTSNKGLQLATTTPEGIAYYTCSMHTSVRKSGPGQCPICSMDLVPVTHEQVQSGVITVDARRRQLIGVESGKAQKRDLTKTLRAVGRVTYDETRLSDVSLRFDAWVGELKADYIGKQVDKGEMLFSVYGPDLLAAQQEYLQVLKHRRGQGSGLAEAARKRLLLWDMTPEQIKQLEQRGEPLDYVPIMAPREGTVVKKDVVAGTATKAGTMLMRIADLSRVWVEAEVYEADLPLIKKGMSASINLPYGPDKRYRAKVDYIYPYLEEMTRTARIRLVLDNPNGALKPDMYAEVKLHADLGQRLVVPEDAVLVAGETRVVFKDMGRGEDDKGRLKPVKVTTGQRVDGWVEITEGLEPGDTVITSGNFLIAAEVKLKTGIKQW